MHKLLSTFLQLNCPSLQIRSSSSISLRQNLSNPILQLTTQIHGTKISERNSLYFHQIFLAEIAQIHVSLCILRLERLYLQKIRLIDLNNLKITNLRYVLAQSRKRNRHDLPEILQKHWPIQQIKCTINHQHCQHFLSIE